MITHLNNAEKEKYVAAINEIVQSMFRIQSESELIAEIAKQNKENYGIPPADTKKIAKIVFDNNFEEAKDKILEPFNIYEELFTK